jgi:PAS domain S-box-containing protein
MRDSPDLEQWLETLQRIADSSENMVVVTDERRRIRWVNATYTRVTGWSLSECMGKRPGELLHGPNTDRSKLEQLSRLLNRGSSASGFELVNYRKSGEPYLVSLNIEPIRDHSGALYAYLSIQSDVTERREKDHRTARLKEHLEEAQRLARLGRIETDDETGEAHWSGEVFRILGMQADLWPRGLSELLAFADPDDRDRVSQECAVRLESGSEIQVEFKVTGAHGGSRWVRCRGLPMHSEGAFAPPLIWSVQDVTFYKSRFEEKRQHNEELNRMVVERTRQLEESYQALEEFSYALSHDLRTPLRHMASYAELLREDLVSGATTTSAIYCDKIVEAAGKMRALIEGMLSFARLGRDALSFAWIDLGPMLREVSQELELTAPDQQVVWNIQGAMPTVPCDPVLMREVWVNLLDNAIKYSSGRPVSEIEVGWCLVEGGWEFYVRDNGVGFDEGHASKLFGMFERLHREHRFKGAGIGLALVRRIVESHRGRVWATAAIDQGATFHIFLPHSQQRSDGDHTIPGDLWPHSAGGERAA